MKAMQNMFESIDFRSLLLEHYKALGFDENHVMVLLMVDQLLRQDNPLITPELLALKMQLPIADIDRILVQLLNKNLIAYTTEKEGMMTSIQPLKNLLYNQFQQTVLRQTQEIPLATTKNVFQTIETAFARSLSPLEISRIRDWLGFGYTETMITKALQDAMLVHKRSIRHMDKLLQKMLVKDNIEREGTPGSKLDHHRIQTDMETFTTHDDRTKK